MTKLLTHYMQNIYSHWEKNVHFEKPALTLQETLKATTKKQGQSTTAPGKSGKCGYRCFCTRLGPNGLVRPDPMLF